MKGEDVSLSQITTDSADSSVSHDDGLVAILMKAFSGVTGNEPSLGNDPLKLQNSFSLDVHEPETHDSQAFPFQSRESSTSVHSVLGDFSLSAPYTTAVFWGDSIAAGMAKSASPGMFKQVIDLGTPGSGFFTSLKPKGFESVPANSAAFIYYGTNDIGSLIGQSDKQIEAYAKRVVDVALQMKDHGAEPVILGLNAPKGAYTGGSNVWKQDGYVDQWILTMQKVNEQYRLQANAAGVTFASTDSQITSDLISSDNLHLTSEGNKTLVSIGAKAIGM